MNNTKERWFRCCVPKHSSELALLSEQDIHEVWPCSGCTWLAPQALHTGNDSVTFTPSTSVTRSPTLWKFPGGQFTIKF